MMWTLLTNGWFFFMSLMPVHQASGTGVGWDNPLYVSTLNQSTMFLILLAPAITMTSFAQERVQGTLQLLFTVPVRDHELILGKFLASFVVLAVMIACTLVQPLVLYFVSDVGGSQLISGYAGMILQAAFFAALGVWISMLVEAPLAAYMLSFGALAVLFLIGLLGDTEEGFLQTVAETIGLGPHLQNFILGDLSIADPIYFIAMTVACLIIGHATIRARRQNG